MLPTPKPITKYTIENVGVADGGEVGTGQEKRYSEVRLSKRKGKMDQVDENVSQHTNIEHNEPSDKPSNNKSKLRLSKNRREAIKKKQHKEKGQDCVEKEKDDDFDDYGAPNSEEEYDEDTQS